MNSLTVEAVAKTIDHALLKPALTDAEIETGCVEARDSGVAGVCVHPCAVRRCAALLAGSGVLPGTVIGFPHGANTTAVKAAEAERAVADGAEELDMVVNIGKVMSRDWSAVAADIEAVTAVARGHGRVVKVIFENACLDEARKIELCRVCTAAGVDFVKTSTGFGAGGATVADVRLMRRHTPAQIRIKASGGIRTLDDVLALLDAGADRIGTSATTAILKACRDRVANRSGSSGR